MLIFGVTGPSGSGKSVLTQVFAGYHALILDADAIYHRLLSENTDLRNALTDAYSTDILTDGRIDRKKLGKIVFSSPSLLEKLNNITHPFVISAIKQQIAKSSAPLAVIDAPLLFESGLDSLCDITISVLSPRESRIERIMQRDQITRQAAAMRIDAQKNDEYYLARSHTFLYNKGTLEAFVADAHELCSRFIHSDPKNENK